MSCDSSPNHVAGAVVSQSDDDALSSSQHDNFAMPDNSTSAEGRPIRLIVLTMSGAEVGIEFLLDDTLRSLKHTLKERVGPDPCDQCIFFEGNPLQNDSLSLADHGLADGSVLSLVVLQQAPAVYFDWTSSHDDIHRLGDGRVSCPNSSCHGGFPVYASRSFSEGWHRWQIMGERGAFAAGIAPEPDLERSQLMYGGTEGMVWAQLPTDTSDDGQGSRSDAMYPFKDPMLVDFCLNFDSNIFECMVVQGSLEFNGRKIVLPMGPGAWVPVVKLTHNCTIRLLQVNEIDGIPIPRA